MGILTQAANNAAVLSNPCERLREILNHALDTAPNGVMVIDYPVNDTRLREVAMAAVIQSPRNWDGAKDLFYKAIKHDAELLWALFAPHRNAAMLALLSEVNSERHRSGRLRDPGHEARVERPALSASTVARPSTAARPSTQDVARAAARVAVLTVLDTFKIDGTPIGDVTPAMANRWAGSREQDARFVRLLTQNLPPDQPIRQFRTAADATAMLAQAQAGCNV